MQKLIPGAQFTCAWDEDVPARTFQRPQMMAKAGVKYLQFSRFTPGIYRWFSPDGSSITCWTPGQYDDSGRPVRDAETETDRTEALKQMLGRYQSILRNQEAGSRILFTFIPAISRNRALTMLISTNGIKNKAQTGLPQIGYTTGSKALQLLTDGGGKIDTLIGERPNVWLYIHGPNHEKALKAGRKAGRTLTAAEKFSTIHALLNNNMNLYPQKQLDKAWADGIYPDHELGWKLGIYYRYPFQIEIRNSLRSFRFYPSHKNTRDCQNNRFQKRKRLPYCGFQPDFLGTYRPGSGTDQHRRYLFQSIQTRG